jgi:hypothetical protein
VLSQENKENEDSNSKNNASKIECTQKIIFLEKIMMGQIMMKLAGRESRVEIDDADDG